MFGAGDFYVSLQTVAVKTSGGGSRNPCTSNKGDERSGDQ